MWDQPKLLNPSLGIVQQAAAQLRVFAQAVRECNGLGSEFHPLKKEIGVVMPFCKCTPSPY